MFRSTNKIITHANGMTRCECGGKSFMNGCCLTCDWEYANMLNHDVSCFNPDDINLGYLGELPDIKKEKY